MRSTRAAGVRYTAVAAAAVLALSACGSDSDTTESADSTDSTAQQEAGTSESDETAGEDMADTETDTDAEADAETDTETDTEQASALDDRDPFLQAITVEEGEDSHTVRLEFENEVPAFWDSVVSEVTTQGTGKVIEVEGDWFIRLDLTGQPEVVPEVEAEGLDDRIAEVRTIGPFEGMLGVAIGVEGNVVSEYEISKDGTTMVIEVSEPESQDEPTEL
ncbi:AMIN-like domain-containing (lipo)protein [Streptomyces bohaiensis]|uniref:AMIN-like domain-containing (lipo)protein n=1 Tax=Streptomyces bohaiensis TaxID=1431344 RepID=UPI003B80B0EA